MVKQSVPFHLVQDLATDNKAIFRLLLAALQQQSFPLINLQRLPFVQVETFGIQTTDIKHLQVSCHPPTRANTRRISK